MVEIVEHSTILAPIERVFNLSRSIDLHLISTQKTKEKAVAGVTTGLIGINEEVTWQAQHLFKKRYFTSRITHLNAPFYFRDEMVKGDFSSFEHEHFFEATAYGTYMTDKLLLCSPYGWLGKLADLVFMEKYIHGLIIERNRVIKEVAESNEWQKIIPQQFSQ